MLRSLFTSLSALSVLIWAALSVDNSWFAQTGLTVFLLALLVCGAAILFLGVRDLIRDVAHFFGARSHNNHHPL
jgi:hypothetical protein